jgi:integrase/recombinase XerD
MLFFFVSNNRNATMPTYNNLPKTSPYFKGKWFDKLVGDLRLDGLAKRTVYGYVRAIRNLADFHQVQPQHMAENQVRQYLLHQIVDLEVASGTQSVILSGIKFFYRTTCPRTWKVLDQTKINYASALPEVITQPQVFQMIDACRTLRMKTFIWTTYTLGLRIGEAVNLQVGDLDSQRMMVHVHRGKGAKDRYIPMAASTVAALRAFWKTHRNPAYLFPAAGRNQQDGSTSKTPMSISTVQGAIKQITEQLNFGKKVSCHTLRHSYATHLLEAGVSLKAIQKFLGHKSLTTTMVYLHLTEIAEADARLVIDRLFAPRSKSDTGSKSDK